MSGISVEKTHLGSSDKKKKEKKKAKLIAIQFLYLKLLKKILTSTYVTVKGPVLHYDKNFVDLKASLFT